MKHWRTASLIIFLLLLAIYAKAQQVFSEGVLKYTVHMYNIANKNLMQKGTYTLYIKGNAIRKELTLEDGFHHVVVNTGTDEIYSLQETKGQKLAILLSRAQLDKDQKKFRGLVCSPLSESRTIAGLKSTKAVVRYSNGAETSVWFSNEWKLTNGYIFERFPDITMLPVVYAYTMSDGVEIQLALANCTATPVANSMFRIPNGYKIISAPEYKRLSE